VRKEVAEMAAGKGVAARAVAVRAVRLSGLLACKVWALAMARCLGEGLVGASWAETKVWGR